MNRSSGCSLCALSGAPPPFEVWRDDFSIVYLSEERALRGHSVVAAKRHVEHLSELDENERSSFFTAVTRLEAALLETIPCDRVVVVKLGLAVPHLHLHLYPADRSMTRDHVVEVIERRSQFAISDDEMRLLVRSLQRRMA